MKKRLISIALSLVLIFSSVPMPAMAQEDSAVTYGTEGVDYAAGQAIVCVEGGVAALNNTNSRGRSVSPTYEAEELMDVSAPSSGKAAFRSVSSEESKSLVLVKSSQDTEGLIADLEDNPKVEYAEPNYYIKADNTEPTDPGYPYQWALNNQLNGEKTKVGTPAVDINAKSAWNAASVSTGDPVIAVVDSGVDYNHPDLKDVMWKDDESIPALKGMGGGTYGYNALGKFEGESSDDPMDKEMGHGTHCAGIIAAQWNKMGGAGVSNGVKIMAIRILAENRGTLASAIEGYAYIQTAAENGVNVVAVNNSWGGGNYNSFQLRSTSTIATAIGEKCGVISCFGSGNSSTNNDLNPASNAKSPYIITVGALDSEGHQAYFSSYGKESVDVFAPGTQILSTTSTDKLLPMNKHEMPAQYLPQLSDGDQNSDKNASYYYNNFETPSSDISLRLLGADGKQKVISEALSPGYASNKGLQLDLSSIPEGENFTIEMVFNRDSLEKAKIDTENPFNFAFLGGFDNAMYGQTMLIQYQKENGNWENINTTQILSDGSQFPARLRMSDHNWNQSSQELNLTDFMKYVKSDKSDNSVVLRLIPKPSEGQEKGTMTGRTEDTKPVFRLDDVGFGKSASDYYYADGTSMATPVVTGMVGLLASKANGNERVYTPKEVMARIKGGVNRTEANDDLIGKSISDGFVDAGAAFDGEQCVPVLNNLEVIDGQATLTGYFFGDKGSLHIGTTNIATDNISQWETNPKSFASTITFKMPANISGKQEVKVTTNEQYGRNFFSITADTKGYKDLSTPNFKYDNLFSSKDLMPITLAATDSKIAYLGILLESNQLKMSLYDIDKNTWEEASLPEDIKTTNYSLFHNMTGGTTKLYLLYPGQDGYMMLGTYSPDQQGQWTSVKTELGGTERLVVYKDQLLVVGGDIISGEGSNKTSDGIKSVRIIDPTTGQIKGNLPDMPEDRSAVAVLASGDKIVVNGGTNGVLKSKTDLKTYTNTMIYDGKEWKSYDDNFMSKENPDFDKSQTLDTAFCALNTGVVAVGPVKNFQTDEMVDTWRFNPSESTWSGDKDVLYSQSKVALVKGAATNGTFYVLATKGPVAENDAVFRSIEVDYTSPTADPSGDTPDPSPTVNPDSSGAAKTNAANQNAGTGLLGNPSAMVFAAVTLLVLLGVGLLIYKKRRQ